MAVDWQPACDLQHLRTRAQMLSDIRAFFHRHGVLEVETPLLCHATGTDPQLDFFATQYHNPPDYPTLYLQTSPEFAMKRLLAAGSGCIFQICKAFRNGESGRQHNPEFTILEWYRVEVTLERFMQEVATLICSLLTPRIPTITVRQIAYQSLFIEQVGLDPLVFDRSRYANHAVERGYVEAIELCGEDHALWLDFLFSHQVQPNLQPDVLWLVHSYPAIQSSLARTQPGNPAVVDRFEAIFNGMELGNGFYELTDANEQAQRFEAEITLRNSTNRPKITRDERLLAALQSGLPECCGIALGLDRILMLITACDNIDQILAFPINNA